MAILVLLVGGLVVVILFLLFVTRIVYAVSLFALLILGATLVGITYASLAIAGVTLAALFQLWGAGNLGWAIAVAGGVGLIAAWAMFIAVVNDVRGFPSRMKTWLGKR